MGRDSCEQFVRDWMEAFDDAPTIMLNHQNVYVLTPELVSEFFRRAHELLWEDRIDAAAAESYEKVLD